jgi:hypothetical protein
MTAHVTISPSTQAQAFCNAGFGSPYAARRIEDFAYAFMDIYVRLSLHVLPVPLCYFEPKLWSASLLVYVQLLVRTPSILNQLGKGLRLLSDGLEGEK